MPAARPRLRRHDRASATIRSCARTRSSSAIARSRALSTSVRSRSARMPSSAKRASSTSTPRWATTRSSDTPPRCRAASACRPASAITARPRSRPRPITARSRARDGSAFRAVPSIPCSSLRRCSWSRCRSRSSPIAFGINMRLWPASRSATSSLVAARCLRLAFFGSIVLGLAAIYASRGSACCS